MSNITSETIDAEYPIAGKDNDTQGFCDNFQIIKDNFAIANSEITSLQQTTIKLDQPNDFKVDSELINLINPVLSLSSLHFYSVSKDVGEADNDFSVDLRNGLYQKFNFIVDPEAVGSTQTVGLSFLYWPDRAHTTSVRLELTTTNDNPCLVVFQGDPSTTATITYKKHELFPDDLLITDSNPVIIDAWSYNSGSTVFLEYKGKFS